MTDGKEKEERARIVKMKNRRPYNRKKRVRLRSQSSEKAPRERESKREEGAQAVIESKAQLGGNRAANGQAGISSTP